MAPTPAAYIAIMAQKRARDQRARPKNENGDPKAAIP
jgi:hypothetical protein